MMFTWFRDRRRKRILEREFPKSWESLLEQRIRPYRHLPPSDQARLQDLVQIFIAEKVWEGLGGLELTDEIRVTIAGYACLLILKRCEIYPQSKSIYVYPSTVQAPPRHLGFFESANEPVSGPVPILGQAFHRGPVVLVWDAIQHDCRMAGSGHNVVYHEFAHQLDFRDGQADGTPVLRSKEELKRWTEVFSREYLELRRRVDQGLPTFLDEYGAVHESEFFAVATEHFFEQSREFQVEHPELYRCLASFYRQDPASLAIF
jgi:Mlc titration factor MtfA (ptsG expression regulator)